MTVRKLEKIVKCPYCGYEMDSSAGAFQDSEPKEGDVSLCISCAGILVFNEQLQAVQPSQKEAEEIAAMPDVILARLSIEMFFGGINNE